MKTPERFDRAIRALVKGFFNETLVKGSCSACAVGNMVAESINCEVIATGAVESMAEVRPNAYWSNVFVSNKSRTTGKIVQAFDPNSYHSEAKENIDATGYCVLDLAEVEKAFESNTRINFRIYDRHKREEIIQDQYNGLMAVVDVLCEIEGIESKEYKDMFAYTEDFKPVNVL